MTVWKLAERLRIAVVGLPLALGGCDKEPRQSAPRAIVIIDAGQRDAPAPAPDAELDAAAPADAAPAPIASVRLPPLRACSEGSWCAPHGQAASHASTRAADFQGCATDLRMRKNSQDFSLVISRSRTKAKQDAGQDLCCYTWSARCKATPGRALLDRGAVVLAELLGGPLPPGGDDDRARTWAERGLGEHASIAAFARAASELAAVDAPPALLAATVRAGRDEVAHARGCFALASRHAGARIQPGPLPALAARPGGLAAIAHDSFLEGCVHETLSVPAALDWQRHASPEERPLLARIIRDETRHAELAWRTVAWAVAAGGPEARDALADAAARARADFAAHPAWPILVEPTLALI
ncbi:MAG: ferritin-like domain-containing protein [Deltaproteobacteria bacterium]|nr:ferritin-like domain-containing protein [Deltaproteobacteria bacterium]